MKIIVLAGGNSPEREVSLSSGSLITEALIRCGHNVALLDLSEDLEDGIDINVLIDQCKMNLSSYQEIKGVESVLSNKKIEKRRLIEREKQDDEKEEIKKDEIKKEEIKKDEINGAEIEKDEIKEDEEVNSLIGKNVITVCKCADAVFLALHGSIGENGKLQALLDLSGIKYTGSGYVGSMLAMDKELSKELFEQHKIQTPKWRSLRGTRWDLKEIKNTFGYPCVVKPSDCGSSIGVKIVNDSKELLSALEEACLFGDKLMIEEMIQGREFSVGILDNKALPPIEIIPKAGFYDYDNKYQDGRTLEICPAEISEELELELENIALQVHQVLRLGYYSRVDIIVDIDNNLYVLEANTLPGMTKNSLLPKEARAKGISFEELCNKIVLSAI